MFERFGIWEIALILLVALLFFGPKKLPELGKSLGQGIRDFKKSIQGLEDDAKPKDEQNDGQK